MSGDSAQTAVVVDGNTAQGKETAVATSGKKTMARGTKIKIIVASLVVVVAAAVAIIVLVVLPGSHGHQKMIITTLSGEGPSQAQHPRRLATDTNKIRVQQSASAFSYMKIDGFQSKLLSLAFVDDKGSFMEVANYKLSPRPFEVGQNAANTSVPFQAKSGNYTGLTISLELHYNLKGYCKTSQYFIYTTVSGLKQVLLASMTDDTVPSDYDYLAVHPKTYLSQTQTDGTFNTGTNQAFSYDATTNVSSLLLDPTNMAACYDGTLTTFEGRKDVLMPFNVYIRDMPDNGYKPSVPAVGLQYLAMFFWAGEGMGPSDAVHATASNSTNATTTVDGPVGETYLFTTNLTAMNDYIYTSEFDINQFCTWSIAFNPDDSVLAIQTRGQGQMDFDSTHFKNITRVGTSDTYVLYNGASELGQYIPSPAADRIFLNFTRIRGDEYNVVMPVALVDGPECTPQTAQMSSPPAQSAHAFCRNSTRILYFRKFPGSLS